MSKRLNDEDILWVAALDKVPVGERIEWVAEMLKRVEEINRVREFETRLRMNRGDVSNA